MYAVDSTSPETDLREVRSLINNAIKPYNLENGRTRMGLVTYSLSSRTIVNFPGIDRAGFSLATDLVEHTSGERDVLQVLNIIKESFYQKNNLRRNARKLVVLFINGNRAIPKVLAFELALRSLNESGIGYVIVIVGGSGSNIANLKPSAVTYGTFMHYIRSEELPDALPFIVKAGAQREGKQFSFLQSGFNSL